jgi:PKHD-type hydroxylase
MKAWWQLFEKALTPEECARIVHRGMSAVPQAATVGHGGTTGVNENIRVSQTAWLPRSDAELMPIFHRLYLMGKQANAYAYGLDLDDFQEVQFTVYDSARKGHYNKHIDLNWKPDHGKERAFQRKMSMVVQLSTPESYDGGRLELENDPLPADTFRNQGDVIFFPSWNPHAVTPVTSGVRYSLVSWFLGPPLR